MHADEFTAVLLSGHKGNAAEVPFDPGVRWSQPAQALWLGRRGFAVRATLDDQAFESAIVPRSRRFWLLVPLAVSQAAAVAVGQAAVFTVAPGPASMPAPGRDTA